MVEKRFLSKETRIFSLVVSVILAISFLSIIIVGLITGSFNKVSLYGSSALLFASAIFMGAMQIKIFSDYKSQQKYLCADGIFNISLTILVAITAGIYFSVPSSKIDLRIFMFIFIMIFAIWKCFISVLGFRKKYFNAFIELLIAIFWMITGIAILSSMFGKTGNVATILLYISNYILSILTIFYVLYSYVFKEPKFLITEKAQMLLDQEYEQRIQRLNRIQSRITQSNIPNETLKQPVKEDSIEDKLMKLASLKEKGFITQEEFDKRKNDILNEEL